MRAKCDTSHLSLETSKKELAHEEIVHSARISADSLEDESFLTRVKMARASRTFTLETEVYDNGDVEFRYVLKFTKKDNETDD